MARLVVEGGELIVRLTPWQKFWAFHRDLRVPLSAIRSVDTPANAWAEMRGWRTTGTGIGGFVALGTRRHGGGYDFVAVLRQTPVVQVNMGTGRYDRLMVSVDGAEAVAAEIASAAGIRR